jgi:photosystem II stability/assembly factor-like uncharacterized protein
VRFWLSALGLAALLSATPAAGSCRCWLPSSRGLPTAPYVLAIAIDPVRPATIYAGTMTHGIQKSADGGATWRPARGLFPPLGEGITERPAAILSLAIDSSSPASLYAGTSSGGVLRTDDGGASWTPARRGLPVLAARTGGSVYPPVAALVVDPSRPRTLYASLLGGGVFKSVDGGGRWRPAQTGLRSSNVEALVLVRAHPNTLYAGTAGSGVFKSVDGGRRWRVAGLPAMRVEALAIQQGHPQRLYAGTLEDGVFESDDAGRHWHSANAGLRNKYVRALEPDPRRPGIVYAGTLGGVFESEDAGRHWRPLNAGLRNRLVQALALAPRSARLYAGTLGSGIYVLATSPSQATSGRSVR